MLTAILTVMMFYIIDALSRNKSVGDGNLRLCLAWATVVIIVFAVIFLFYTNSFLIKRRKRKSASTIYWEWASGILPRC